MHRGGNTHLGSGGRVLDARLQRLSADAVPRTDQVLRNSGASSLRDRSDERAKTHELNLHLRVTGPILQVKVRTVC